MKNAWSCIIVCSEPFHTGRREDREPCSVRNVTSRLKLFVQMEMISTPVKIVKVIDAD